MIPPQVNGATPPEIWQLTELTELFPMIPPQVNGATTAYMR